VPRDHSTQSITSLLNDVIDESSMDRNNLYVVSSATIKDAITEVILYQWLMLCLFIGAVCLDLQSLKTFFQVFLCLCR